MVAVVGSANMDLVVRVPKFPLPGQTLLGTDFQQIPGGKGANQAVAAARAGSSVAFIGCLGTDAYGTALRQCFQTEGIDHTACLTKPGSTGVALITVTDFGENTILVCPGTNHQIDSPDISAALDSREPKVLLVQLEINLSAIETALQAPSIRILNPAPARSLPPQLLHGLDWIIPNENEAETLTGIVIQSSEDCRRAAKILHAFGVQGVIITRGHQGVFTSLGETAFEVEAPQVTAIDTTAAGDTFCGYFAALLDQGFEVREAVQTAVQAASQSVTVHGAQPSIPRRDQLPSK